MAHSVVWRGVMVCLCVAMAAGGGAQRVRSDQEILIQLERDWDAAFNRNDVGFIASILDDDFIATYDDGTRVDKKRELELVAGFNQQIDSSTLDDFVVHTYGNTAVVWFTLRRVGPMQGKRVELTYRYTDVWVLKEGRWVCVASHSARVVPKAGSVGN
jgi:ketosteroid isomerase-like protein